MDEVPLAATKYQTNFMDRFSRFPTIFFSIVPLEDKDLPDLPPIELCWSKLKQFLPSREARTLEALNEAVKSAVNYITAEVPR